MPLPFYSTTHRPTNAHPTPRDTTPISPPGTNPGYEPVGGGVFVPLSTPLRFYKHSDEVARRARA